MATRTSFAPRLMTICLLMASVATAGGATYRNVYGDALQSCSSDGMALTGYTRSGSCVDRDDDSGSHHICIDLTSLGGGDGDDGGGDNFCDVTGQSDWCSAEDMPCHEDADDSACPVTNWCVCQWAFASYLEKAGGCDQIQTVVCESINQQAVIAYQQKGAEYQDALECLVDRCALDSGHLSAAMTRASASRSIVPGIIVILGAATVLAAAGAYLIRKRAMRTKTVEPNYVGAADSKAVPALS